MNNFNLFVRPILTMFKGDTIPKAGLGVLNQVHVFTVSPPKNTQTLSK